MILTPRQIQDITLGATRFQEENEALQCYHARAEHIQAIRSFQPDWGKKISSTAGIRLDFTTDSDYFAFSYDGATGSSSRTWYYFELLINGKHVALIGEDCLQHLNGSYRVALPEGEKRVTLVFPNLFRARITRVELSDGATFTRVKPKGVLAFYGDSITQGYDAKAPSKSYVNRIALQTDCEAFDFGIGGALFDERLIDMQERIRPDGVFVAYGTNDWEHDVDKQTFARNVQAFLQKLRAVYPVQPIFVILPIWRIQHGDVHCMGSFSDLRACVSEIAAAQENVRVIDLWEDIPQNLALFSDGLHPNDDGFAYYANGVLQRLQGVLKI